MSKQFLAILGILILGFLGFVVFQSNNNDTPSGNDQSQASNHTYGEDKKNITLVEYGDFQCPVCSTYFPIIEQVKEQYKEDIKFQFISFPLTQIHPNAMAAHRAAEAASNQGKFWEMYDILYERQQLWSTINDAAPTMDKYAEEIGLNIDQFKTDFQSAAVNATINADMAKGNGLNVTGTPTFYLNDQKIENAEPSFEFFKKLIDDKIAEQTGSNNEPNQ